MSAEKAQVVKAIDQFVIKVMMDRKLPGICLGIIRDGDVFYSRGYGYRNLSDQLPMTPDTLYGIGSSSKSFTALAVMQLVEQGKIKLDAPVSDYIDFQFGTKENPITIHHLLSHSSGVQDFEFVTAPFLLGEGHFDYIVPISNKDDYMSVLNSAKEHVRFSPGDVFMYNNDFFQVLGLIIESVTEGTYEEYITENIIRPIGMGRTTYYKDQFLNDPLNDHMQGYAIGTDSKGVKEQPFPFGKTIDAAGGILSSANEMLKYLQMMLNKGTINTKQIIKPDSIERMWTGVIKTPYARGKNPQYCYGWMREDDFFETTLIHHAGNAVACSNEMMIMPEKGIGIVVGQNMDNELCGKIARGILAILLNESPEKAVPELIILAKLGSILGEYSTPSGASSLRLFMEGPLLTVIAKTQETILS